MSIRIRAARTEDAQAIARVHVQSWQVTYAGILSAQFLAALDQCAWAERWRGRLQEPQPNDAHLVLLENDELIGFIAVGAAGKGEPPTLGELRAIYLDPRRTSQGHGGRLLRAGEDAMRAAGFSGAVLWVAAANQQARSFYEREGWRAVGEPITQTVSGASILSQRYQRRLPRDAERD